MNLGDSYAARLRQSGDQYAGSLSKSGRGVLTDVTRPLPIGLKEKDLCGIPWRVAFALQADGWWLRSDIIWAKPNPMPESVTDRPTKSHEYIFMLTKSASYFFDQDAVKEPSTYAHEAKWDPGTDGLGEDDRKTGKSTRRFKTPGKNSREFVDRDPAHLRSLGAKLAGANGVEVRAAVGNKFGPAAICPDDPANSPITRNIRTVWNMATQPYSGAHFATFPEELAERCIKAGSKKGSIVLDPFSGAGTTVLVADKLNRRGIGLDLKPEYCALGKNRCHNDAPLFTGVSA